MEECTEWELNDIVNNIPYVDRNIWETSRMQAYVTAQVNSRKKLDLQDICKFKWEENPKDKSETEISNEDIKRLKELSKQWES